MKNIERFFRLSFFFLCATLYISCIVQNETTINSEDYEYEIDNLNEQIADLEETLETIVKEQKLILVAIQDVRDNIASSSGIVDTVFWKTS